MARIVAIHGIGQQFKGEATIHREWWPALVEEARDRVRQLEADLAHTSRVSTMGELTASLAHEIKQPIGAAVTNAEACCRMGV